MNVKKSVKDFLEVLDNQAKKAEKQREKLKSKIEQAEKTLGRCGCMLSGSKSYYSDKFPNNVVVFNSNVCIKAGKIWFGDLDITVSMAKLKKLAKVLDENVYVLYEQDARFMNELDPKLERAVCCVASDGTVTTLDERNKKYIGVRNGKLVRLE